MPYIGAGLTRFNTADELTVTGTSEFNSTITATTDDNNPQLIVKSTDADSTSGPEIELFRDSASPADSDALGQIQFKGNNDASQELTYVEIDSFIRDASDGTEDGEIRLNVRRNGNLREGIMINESIVTFNESGDDVDFRIEADSETHAFFLNGGTGFIGINEDSPQAQMHITTSDFKALQLEGPRPTAFFKETDGSADENFQLRVNGGSFLISKQNDAQDNAVDVLTVKQSGDVEIDNGNLVLASGHGIDFSATANSSQTMSAELLDDYEEGTWTPSPNASSGNSPSFGTVSGLYTKIGRMVFIRATIGNIDTSGTTSSAQLQVQGLPFTCDGSFGIGEAITDNITLQGGRTQLSTQVGTSEIITFTQSGNSLSETPTDMGDIDSSSSDIFLSAFYYSNE